MNITAMALLGMFLVGCSGMVPNIPIKAPPGYTAAQVSADEKACATAREGREHKEDFYAACMISKGYTTHYGMGGFGVSSDNYMVRALENRTSDVVETDLRACEDVAKEKTEGIRNAANATMWLPGLAAIAGGMTGMEARSEYFRYFNSCMAPRGYSVEKATAEEMKR